jgi:hypothetical protein
MIMAGHSLKMKVDYGRHHAYRNVDTGHSSTSKDMVVGHNHMELERIELGMVVEHSHMEAIWSWSILNWVWNGIWNRIVVIVATTDAVSYTTNDVANGTTSQGCASSKSITSEETATEGERSSEGSTCCEWSETQTEEWEKSVKKRWLT